MLDQWDGLGHIFDHGRAWNGRPAGQVVTALGDQVTGIETVAAEIISRGILLDVGRVIGTDGELADGFAVTVDHLEQTMQHTGWPVGWHRRHRAGTHRTTRTCQAGGVE